MKQYLTKFLSLLYFVQIVLGQQTSKKIVCYYDAESETRPGFAKLSRFKFLDAVNSCTHLIFGYAVLTNDFDISIPNTNVYEPGYISFVKQYYPHLKIYLSLGGDKDPDAEGQNKYIDFLESGRPKFENFRKSAIKLLKEYNFDGLDLAFQFPRNKPRKVHSTAGTLWKQFKKLLTGDYIVDKNAETHKQQFTDLVGVLQDSYGKENLTKENFELNRAAKC